MSCSCHINPPCNWCVESYECGGCGKIRHPQEHGQSFDTEYESCYCDSCLEDHGIAATKNCECGKDKHEFYSHSNWCPKYESSL